MNKGKETKEVENQLRLKDFTLNKYNNLTCNISATYTSPIMHLICPPQILHINHRFSFFLGITVVDPKRN